MGARRAAAGGFSPSASGVGASRIVLNAHFLSDVLGGALFGWWAGEAGFTSCPATSRPAGARARRDRRPGVRRRREPDAAWSSIRARSATCSWPCPRSGTCVRSAIRTTLAVTARLVALFEGSGLVDAAVDLEGLALHGLFVEPPECRSAPGPCGLRRRRVVVRGGGSRVSREPRRARPPGGGGAGRPAAGHRPPREPSSRRDPGAAGTGPGGDSLGATRGGGDGPGGGQGVARGPGDSGRPRRSSSSPVRGARPRRGRASRTWGGDSATRGYPWSRWPDRRTVRSVEALLAAGAVAEDAVARDWSFGEIAALLSLARATVGNDSGPTHLAAVVGLPDRGGLRTDRSGGVGAGGTSRAHRGGVPGRGSVGRRRRQPGGGGAPGVSSTRPIRPVR